MRVRARGGCVRVRGVRVAARGQAAAPPGLGVSCEREEPGSGVLAVWERLTPVGVNSRRSASVSPRV